MKKLELTPCTKEARKLKVIVHDYWYRSASGFGYYTKEIAQKTFERVYNNSSLYHTTDPDGVEYFAKVRQLGRGYYLMIRPKNISPSTVSK